MSILLNQDSKVAFVMNIYDAITKQIQHSDIKTSILLSWVGITAVMLGREIITLVTAKVIDGLTLGLIILIAGSLIYAGYKVYQVLRPRTSDKKDEQIMDNGLLWAGDILRLGKTPGERMEKYLNELLTMKTEDDIYRQFVHSIIIIADIQQKKNNRFIGGLIATSIAFGALVALIAITGIRAGKIQM